MGFISGLSLIAFFIFAVLAGLAQSYVPALRDRAGGRQGSVDESSGTEDARLIHQIADWLWHREWYAIPSRPVTDQAFSISDPEGRRIQAYMQPRSVELRAPMPLDATMQVAVGRMPKVERDHMLNDLRIDITRLGIGYENIVHPLVIPTIAHSIERGALHEPLLMENLIKITQAMVLLRQGIQRAALKYTDEATSASAPGTTSPPPTEEP